MSAGLPAASKLEWSRCLCISQAFPAVSHGKAWGSRLKQQRRRHTTSRSRECRARALLPSTCASRLGSCDGTISVFSCTCLAYPVASICHCQVLHETNKAVTALQRPVMKQNVSSSESFGSIDEELLKELKKVPAVLATQDELDLVEVVKGLQHRLKVQPRNHALPQEIILSC